MSNNYFQFKQFIIYQDKCSQKVSTDACILGALVNISTAKAKILDIGTGTGLLSLMLAQKSNTAIIDAVEIEEEVFLQAKQNIEKSCFNSQIEIYNEDILRFKNSNYDIVVCNPPFYEKQLQSENSAKNIAWHSSSLSLKELLLKVSELLNPNGEFYILIPFYRLNELYKLSIESSLCFKKVIYVQKTEKHKIKRVVVVLCKNELDSSGIKNLIISKDEKNYTQDFIELMKMYYMSL